MGSGEEHERRVEELARSNDAAALIEALDEPKACWHTRASAIASLVRIGAVESAPAILKLLARESDPDTREACIDALGAFRFAQAQRLLEHLAAGTDSVAAKARAALVCVKIRP
jgi:HEAT repeat protein